MKLDGKVALIVGCGSGIGKAASKLLASVGAKVMMADIDLEAADRAAAEIRSTGGNVATFQVDMTKVEETQEMVRATLENFGRIDILVNVAGGSQGRFIREKFGPFAQSTKVEWDRIIDVNLNGARNCTRAVINHMMERGSGKIVSMSSMAGVTGAVNAVDYSAAKAGIIGFTKALAQEMSPYGIQVNCISPSGVFTERIQATFERRLKENPDAKPLDPSMLATPEEVAEVILFLATDTIRSVNGDNILVNGARRS